MATLDDVIAKDVALKAQVDKIVALVSALNVTVEDLKAAIAAVAQDPAKIDQLVADLDAQSTEIAGALPVPEPTPEPEPVPDPEPPVV